MKRRPLIARLKRAVVGAWAEMFGGTPYSGAESSRLLADWVQGRMAPDDELRWGLDRLRRRARDLEKNNALIRNYLRMLAVNVVGPEGFHLEAEVRDNSSKLNAVTNEKIEDGWEEWAQRPTISGTMDLSQFQRMVLKGVARDGEAFVRLWRGFEGNRFAFGLECIDPELVEETFNIVKGPGQSEVRMSIEVDDFARPLAYYVLDRPASVTAGLSADRRRLRIPADQIIHLYDPDRPNQTRGPTWFASIMVPAKMLDGYVESELVAARVSAAKMGFFQRKLDSNTNLGNPGSDEAAFTMEANPGTFGILPDGYELSSFDPNHPNAAFGEFMKSATRRIAAGLGVSYNSLTGDLEAVNYSSLRSGLLLERDMWRTLQQWWISAFIRPVYREWLNSALLAGALRLDSRNASKFLEARWSPRGWAWVDPLKDTQAGVLGIQAGLTSRSRLLAEQGFDIEDTLEHLKEEKDLADEYGIDIAGAPPAKPGADAGAGPPEDAPEDATDPKMPAEMNGLEGISGGSRAAVLARGFKAYRSSRATNGAVHNRRKT